jgi:reactive intermediate/imine deaminase
LTVLTTLLVPAIATGQNIERINPAGMTQPTSYSHVVRVDDMIFIAGQTAVDGAGNLIGSGDMGAQLRQVMENLKTILTSQGVGFGNVVKINVFTVDVEAYREVSALRQEYFGSDAPASTLVQIERLARPEFLIEIEAIAVAPRSD